MAKTTTIDASGFIQDREPTADELRMVAYLKERFHITNRAQLVQRIRETPKINLAIFTKPIEEMEMEYEHSRSQVIG